MKQAISKLLPTRLRPAAGMVYNYMEYQLGKRIGLRDPLLPPKWLHSVSGQPLDLNNFKDVGDEFFKYFVAMGGLLPHERVLDVGSGTGRMARPLTAYLTSGSYEGIDIVAPSVKWCQETYGPRFPNFRFHFSDIYNKTYNPTGKYSASEYKFPFEDATFDFVFLTSVFTHMLPLDHEGYFSEIARVLKRGGRCLITYFLLNQESLALIDAKISPSLFAHRLPGCRVAKADVPEDQVAYDESTVRGLCQKHCLDIVEPIHFGSWPGRTDYLSFQDILVATKS